MRRRIIGAIIAGTLTLAAAGTVRAGCCDDFWGCAAAVFTAGVSCKVQQIADLIANLKKLIAAVDQIKANVAQSSNDTVDGAKDAVEKERSDVQQKTNASLKRIGDADQKLQLLVNPAAAAPAPITALRGTSNVGAAPAAVNNQATAAAPAGPLAAPAPVTAAPAGPRPVGLGTGAGSASQAVVEVPADPARLKDALLRAAAIVSKGKNDATTKDAPAIQTSSSQASTACKLKEPEARALSNTNLVVPLNTVRDTLVHAIAVIANPVDFTDISKLINAQIAQINAKAPPTYSEMADKMLGGARQQLDEANTRSDKLDDQSQMATKISDLSEKAQQTKTKSALDKLEAVIGKPMNNVAFAPMSLAALSTAGRAAPSMGVLASARVTTAVRSISAAAASRVTGPATALAQDWNALLPQLTAPPLVMSTQVSGPRFDAEFAKKFQGKSREEAEQTKAQLLTEARSRFANDPKTLEAFEKYLNEKSAPIIQSAAPARASSRSSPSTAPFAPVAR
jgi:hypothetical protein